jgi:PAS domain S-box-containing protein
MGLRRREMKLVKLNAITMVSIAAFMLVILLVFVNEIFDFPSLLFNAPPTPVNWVDIGIVSFLVLLVGSLTIFFSWRLILKREQAEEALRESEEKFAKTFRASPNLFSITTLEDGTYIDVNDSYTRVTGYSREEMIGHTVAEFSVWAKPEDRDKVMEIMEKEGRVSDIELQCRKKSGEIHTVLFSSELINIGGEPYVISMGTDITERKQAAEKYRAILGTALDGFWLSDLKGRFLEVNDAYCSMIGYTREELLEMSIPDIEEVENPDDVARRINKIMKQGSDRFESRHRRKDGGVIDVEVSVNYLAVEEGRMFVFIRDVTERKQAEEQLRIAERNFRNSIDNSPLGIRIITMDGELLYANKAILDIYGYSSLEEMRDTPIKQRYTPGSYAEYKERKKRRESGKPVPPNYEIGIIRKDGEIRHLTASRKAVVWNGEVQFQTIYQDVTEGKQAVEALRESEEKFTRAFRANPHAVFIARLDDGRLIEVNNGFVRFTGYTQKELLGHNMGEFGIAATAGGREVIVRKLREKKGVRDEERLYRTKSGESRTGLLSADIILVNGVECMVGVITDITERKQAEEMYRTLASGSPIGVYIVQDGKFQFVNPQFRKDTGFTEDELLHTDHLRLVHLEDRGKVRKNAVAMLKGKRSSPYEFRAVGKDGKSIWALETVTSIHYQGKRAVLGNFMDITERKQAEEALRESEEKFATAFHASPDAISIVTVDDGKIIDVNEGFTRFTGYTSEEAIGKSAVELGLWANPEEGKRMLGLLKESPGFYNEEFSSCAKSGEVRVGLFSMELLNIGGRQCRMSVIRDITERKQAEEALRESEEKFATAFRASPDAISIVTVDDGKIIDVNEGFARFTGYTREEAIGKTPTELGLWVEPEEDDRMLSMLKKNPGLSNEEFACYTKSGETRVGLFSTETLNIGGRQCGMSVIKDITERKKIEEQLVVTDRLVSIGELASGIAHELNNPLTGVIGFSELLLNRDVPDDIKEDLELINREARRTAGVVRNLLTFARGHSQEKKSVDVNEVIESVLQLRAYEHRANNIHIDTRLASALPGVMADDFQLRQVFLNIVINAEHFMIEAHGRGNLTITTEQADGLVRASFADDGPGIARKNLRHLFDPFFTTKEIGKGTGLGLSICHGIVTEHGGNIYAESGLGKGATFIVELPVSKRR